MNFQEFTQQLPALRTQHPGVLDLTETRVTHAFADLRRTCLQGIRLPEKGHRCHISKAWANRLRATFSDNERILVSEGVRHSLRILFRAWAQQGLRAALPGDVYPVYLQIAQEEGLAYGTYSVTQAVAETCFEAYDIVLCTNPAKPRGSYLASFELFALSSWVARRPHRRIVLDAVYDLDAALHPSTAYLLRTERCIVLHSLSKAWLAPLRAGVALVPRQDVATWTPRFRAEAVDRGRLAEAEALLLQASYFPTRVQQEFDAKMRALSCALRTIDVRRAPFVGAPAPGYLVCLDSSWDSLLKKGVLAMPLSVYGDTDCDWSVVSSLALSSA